MPGDELSFFLAENVEKVEHVKIPVSKRIKDADGNPVLWEIRPVPTEEVNRIQSECIEFKGRERSVNFVKFQSKLAAAAVVYPDLYNAKLQDSWGVKTPEALLMKMLSDKSEYDTVLEAAVGGMDEDFEDIVEDAKN